MKFFKYFLIVLVIAVLLPIYATAETITTGVINASLNLKIRSGPGTSYDRIGTATYMTTVTILSVEQSGDGCEKEWLKIKTSAGLEGYVCSDYVEDIQTRELTEEEIAKAEELKALSELGDKMVSMTDEEFEQYLTLQGFPESYKVKLRSLHKEHPSWIFKGVKSKYTWTNALNAQDSSGTSLLNVNPTYAKNGYEGYLSIASTDYNHLTNTFIAHDGTYWFQANRDTIAYYMDPRNFLDEKHIFMFEELFYYPSYQTESMVKTTLSSAFLQQYSPYFMEASDASKVSPIFLASLVKQEVGTSNTNICTNGNAGVLGDGVNYAGYYNFFNIGASSSSNPKLKSLQYAKSAGWDSPQKAIVNGSKIISNNYVNCGQYTSYFQKFNLAPTATKGLWHQYTTNVSALVSPAVSSYNAYYTAGLMEKDFVFAIPYFDGMPDTTFLPRLGNPNNWLSSLTVNGSLVTNFDSDNLNYTVNVSYSETVDISAVPVVNTSTVSGVGIINLTGNTTVLNVVVTAQNGSTRTYTITVIREEKPVDVAPPTPVTPPVEEPKEDSFEEPNVPNDENEEENNNNENNGNNGNNQNDNENNENNQNENNEDNENNQNEEPKEDDKPEPTVVQVDLNEVLNYSKYKYNDKYMWNVTLGSTVSSVTEELMKNYKTITVNVFDKSNNSKSQGRIVTGDKIMISSNGVSKTMTVVIYGDVNGSGTISAVDLLHVQKHILGFTTLTDSLLTAADVNKDSKISAIDLLQIQKHLLGYTNISQG